MFKEFLRFVYLSVWIQYPHTSRDGLKGDSQWWY